MKKGMSSTTSEPIYINGDSLHKWIQTFFAQRVCVLFQNYVRGHCGLLHITQRNFNSSAQQNRFNKSLMQAKINLFFIAFCKVHLGSFGFQTRSRRLFLIPFTYFDGRLSWRSNSIPLFRNKTLQRRERNENTEHPTCHFRFEADVDTIQLRSRMWPKCSIRFIMWNQLLWLSRFPAVINYNLQFFYVLQE